MSITSLVLRVTVPVEGEIKIINHLPKPKKSISSNSYMIAFPGEILLSMTRYNSNITIEYAAFYNEQKTDDIEKILQNINAKPISSVKDIMKLINIENPQPFKYHDLDFTPTSVSYDLEESILGAVYEETNKIVSDRMLQ